MKRAILISLLFLQINLFAQSKHNSELSIAGTFMVESDNLFIAEANRYFFVGDALLLKAEYDYYLDSFSKHFGLGLYINIGSPWYDGYEETSMTEIGTSLKWKFFINKVVLIPAAYVGYRSYEGSAGEGLGLNLSVKAQLPQDKFIPFAEIGFLTQPVGGNDESDATYSPVFIFGGGVAFGF